LTFEVSSSPVCQLTRLPVLTFWISDFRLGIEKKEKMNIEHSTLNIERRMKNKAGVKFLI